VLGATAERNFHQAMIMGDGSWSIFTTRWVCLVLIAAIVLFLALPTVRARLFPGRKSTGAAGAGKA